MATAMRCTFTTSNLPTFCSLTDNTGPTGNLQCTPGFTDAGTYAGVTVTVSDGNLADDDLAELHAHGWGRESTPVLDPDW